ncbi:hypothetical protein ACIQX3_21875 [Peribacillus frigoritolerans]|uniref:hypothetical protein n=1 Tax=Peribacillus frigoritolerans TaxID=450367 RepID=UPI0038047662
MWSLLFLIQLTHPLLCDRIAKIEGSKNEFKRFQAPVLTLNKEEEEDIFDNLIHLFDGVDVEGEIQEVKEEEPIDQLKRWIANTGELRVNELARLIGLWNNKVHAMMVELVYLKKEGRSYAINVNDEELDKWRDKNDTFYDCIDNTCCNLLSNDQRNRLYV